MANPQLPPGQQLAARDKWPLIGERRPAQSDKPWSIRVFGTVAEPASFSLSALREMPRSEAVVDIHCVTRWSKLKVPFGGVLLRDLLDQAGIDACTRYVSFLARSDRNHDTSLLLTTALERSTLVADEVNGKPLAIEHGGPVRLVVPGRYFYKSLKWLDRIELLADDRLGFWERTAGYHNEADPWKQQRYMSPSLTKQQMHDILSSRDFSGRDLRSLHAVGHDLRGINARKSLMRDAHLSNCDLRGADFTEASLSNVDFRGADLRACRFNDADVEGVEFLGADLRAADFRGAALVGATFCDDPQTVDTMPANESAVIDSTTRFELSSLEDLSPPQSLYVRRSIGGASAASGAL